MPARNSKYMAAGKRWYLSKQELDNTPSRRCGIDFEKELSYRQQAANFTQDMGQRLQVNQLCINTAIVYMHRFFVFHSFSKFHRNAISTCALFLAAKVEEQPRKLEHVIKVAHSCLHRDAPQLDTKCDAFLEQAQELVINENIMLQTLGFDVAIDHPHTHVVKCCQLVRGGWSSANHHASKDLAQTSYFMATNSLHLTTMCLQYKPTVVACVCIHLACKWANWEIPQSYEGKPWFKYVDESVTQELLETLTAEFLAIMERCPSRLKRKMMSASGTFEKMPDRANTTEASCPATVSPSTSRSGTSSASRAGTSSASGAPVNILTATEVSCPIMDSPSSSRAGTSSAYVAPVNVLNATEVSCPMMDSPSSSRAGISSAYGAPADRLNATEVSFPMMDSPSTSRAGTSSASRGYLSVHPPVRDNLFDSNEMTSSRSLNAVEKNGAPVLLPSDRKHKKELVQNNPAHRPGAVNNSSSTTTSAAKHALPPKTMEDRHSAASNAFSQPAEFPTAQHNSGENYLQPPSTSQQHRNSPASNSGSTVKRMKATSKEYRANPAMTTATPASNVESEKPKHYHHHHHQQQQHGGSGDQKPQQQHHQGNHVGRSHRIPQTPLKIATVPKPPILTPSPPTHRDESFLGALMPSASSPKMSGNPLMATPPTPLLPVACETLTTITVPPKNILTKGEKRKREDSVTRIPVVEPPPPPQRRHEVRDHHPKDRQIKAHKSKTPPVIPHVAEMMPAQQTASSRLEPPTVVPISSASITMPQKPSVASHLPPPPVAATQLTVGKPDNRQTEQEISKTVTHSAPPSQPPLLPPAATMSAPSSGNPVEKHSSSSLNETAPHSRLPQQLLVLGMRESAEIKVSKPMPEAVVPAPVAVNPVVRPMPPPPSEVNERHASTIPKQPHQSSKREKKHKSKSRDRNKERSHDKQRESSSSLSSMVGATPAIPKLLIPKERLNLSVTPVSGSSKAPQVQAPLRLKISKEKLNEGSSNSSKSNSFSASAPPPPPPAPKRVSPVAQPLPPPQPAPETGNASLKIKITKDRTGGTGTYNLSVGSDNSKLPERESRKRERSSDVPKMAKPSARSTRRSGESGNNVHGHERAGLVDVPPSSNTRSSGGYSQAPMHQQPHVQPQQRGRKSNNKAMNMPPQMPYGHINPAGYPHQFPPQFYGYRGPAPPAMQNYYEFPQAQFPQADYGQQQQQHQLHLEYQQQSQHHQNRPPMEYVQHQQFFSQFPPPRMQFSHPPPPLMPPPPQQSSFGPPLPTDPPPAIPPPPPEC